MLDLCLYHSEGILTMHGVNWNGRKIVQNLYKDFDFCQYRNDVSPVMASFWWWPSLLVFYLQLYVCYNSKCLRAYLVCRKVIKTWPARLLGMAMQCLHLNHACDCDFLRGILQRNGYDLHASLKAELSISAMWLQAVMSVSRCTLLYNVWPLVVWSNVIVIRMLKYRMAKKIWIVTNRELYASAFHSCFARHAFLTIGVWINPPDVFCWEAWIAWHKTICCLDQEYMHVFHNFWQVGSSKWSI